MRSIHKFNRVKKHYLDEKKNLILQTYVYVQRKLLEVKLEKKDINFLIFVSQSRDYVLPASSCILQEKRIKKIYLL